MQYHTLFDDGDGDDGDGDDGDGDDGGGDDGGGHEHAESSILLREWVSVASLAPPPPPPSSMWYKHLKRGDKCEALHEGGWWQVVVHSKIPAKTHAKEPPKCARGI